MALVLADRVLETTPVAGTGDANLSGAVTGYQPFSTIGGGNTTYYTIVAIDDQGAPTGDWEVGIGTYVTSGNKLTRDTVLSSSNGGAKVYFASGTKQIFLDLPSEEVTNGNVVGPASAVADNFASFNMTTGKLIKDSGYNASSFATAAQGAKADTAVQPGSLGTAAYLNAGVANGVATLDSGGQVPLSQIPPLGDLNYQGTWNASTNTPTLTSSAGTKGFYYVVSVAGTTNLNGITDWQVGDWAVFNGSVWQKIDNTDLVTSVNGYTGSVVLTYTDVGAFPATSTTGSGNVVLATGATQSNPTISNYETFTPSSAPSYAEGELWYDNTQKALTYFNDVTNNQVHIGQEVQLKVINNTGSSIANGTPVYVTGTSSGQSYPNIALAKADAASTSAVLGLTNGTIASGAVGYVCTSGLLTPCNTGSFSVGQVLYLSPYSAGQMMNTVPPTGYAVQIGVVAYANTPNGSIYVKQTTPLAVSASTIVGQVAVANGGTGAATLTGYVKGSGASAMTASSTIPTTDLSGTITNAQLANSSITINGNATALGGSVSVGTVTSVSGTAPISSSGGATPTISISQATTSTNGYLSSTDWNTFNNKQPAGTYVTSVTGTAPVVSSGGTTPAISMAAATTSVSGYLTSTDWNTFNGKYSTGGALGTPSSGTLTNCTGLPVGGISATGTPSSTTYLRGDGTWSTPTSVGINSVTGTSPVTVTTTLGVANVSLSSGYGDTQNPYASKTANYFLAAPNGSSGTPSFRAIVAADIPVLNQNTTGTATYATNIANGGAGQIPYNTGSGATSFLAAGTTGQVLLTNGTSAPSWGSSVKFATSIASTSGTSIAFTSIPSWVRRITVMFDNVSTNGSSLVQLQLGSTTYTTSGYNGNTGNFTSGTPNVVTESTGFYTSSGGSASDFRSGTFTLTNLTGNTWICTGQFAVGAYFTFGTGQVALSGTLDRVRVTTANGTDTFDNGNINILYE